MPSTPRKQSDRACQPLRQRAEQFLQMSRQDLTEVPWHDLQRLVHELQLHQVELDMQNEELRRAQLELKVTRDRYADLYDFAPVGYLNLDADGVILEANLTASHMLGVARSRLRRRRVSDFVAPEAQDALHFHRQQVFADPTPCTCDLWMQRQDGTPFYVRLKSLARQEAEGAPLQWRLALVDLTALRQSQDQLRRLARHQQHQQEQERAAMAREIHDEVAQTLTGLHLDLAWLAAHLTTNPAAHPAAHERLQAMARQINTLDKSVHRIAMELRPGLLDDLGLLAAIEWQLEETQQHTGLRFIFKGLPETLPLGTDRSTALFRIFQEALTNVVRHAHASLLTVQVKQNSEVVCLILRDNGTGMAPEQMQARHALGLLGMRERAQLWGGTVSITSQPGRGTTVVVRMPYRATTIPETSP